MINILNDNINLQYQQKNFNILANKLCSYETTKDELQKNKIVENKLQKNNSLENTKDIILNNLLDKQLKENKSGFYIEMQNKIIIFAKLYINFLKLFLLIV